MEDCFYLGVKTLIQNEKGELLLLERKSRTKGIYWDIPGGRMCKGEGVLDALSRELEEEIGLKNIGDVSPFSMFLTNIRIASAESDAGLILSVYHYKLNSAFTPQLSSEHFNYGWFIPAEAAKLLKNQFPADFLEKLRLLF